MRGSNGFGKGPRKVGRRHSSFILIRKKTVLGDTCWSHLHHHLQAQTPPFAIAMFLSRWLKPSSVQPKPGPDQMLQIWESENPEVWNTTNIEKYFFQNPNPCHPNCRQGLDWPEKELPGPISCHFISFFPWTEKIQHIRNC